MSNNKDMENKIRHRIGTKEVSRQTGLSTVTIWRKSTTESDFPRPVYIGGKKLFYQDEITRWIKFNERATPKYNNLVCKH